MRNLNNQEKEIVAGATAEYIVINGVQVPTTGICTYCVPVLQAELADVYSKPLTFDSLIKTSANIINAGCADDFEVFKRNSLALAG